MRFWGNIIFFGLLGAASGCASNGAKPMDKNEIRRVLIEHSGEINQCYKEAEKLKPGLAGKLLVTWDIQEIGRVGSVRVDKPLHPKLDKCVMERLASWQFPPPPEDQPTRVTFPFIFEGPSKEKPRVR